MPDHPTPGSLARATARAIPCCRRHWPASPPRRGSASCGCRPPNAPSCRIPLVALLRLVHLGIACLVGILGRGRRIDDRRIDNRAGGHLQSLRCQVPLHFVEQLLAQIVLLEQVTEAAHRRLVGHRLAAEIDVHKTPHCQRIVKRLFHRRVRQIEPLLQEIKAQHPLDPDRRAAIARRRVERLDQRAQRRPRHNPLHLGKKRCPPRRLGVALKPHCRQRQLLHPPTQCSNPPRQTLYHHHCNRLVQSFPNEQVQQPHSPLTPPTAATTGW